MNDRYGGPRAVFELDALKSRARRSIEWIDAVVAWTGHGNQTPRHVPETGALQTRLALGGRGARTGDRRPDLKGDLRQW